MPSYTKPLDLFWVLSDEQSGERVAYVSVAYHRTHHQSGGGSYLAISPTFKTSDEAKAHIQMMIADLTDALASVDGAFQALS